MQGKVAPADRREAEENLHAEMYASPRYVPGSRALGLVCAALVVATALRSKLVSALRTGMPMLLSSSSSPSSSSSATLSSTNVRWTVLPESDVRTALSEDTRHILESAWRQDEELARFSGRHFAEPLVQTAHGLEMHHALAWTEGGGLPDGPRPGLLLLHTAVGPHDLWMRWRAQSLAARGYVVLIADLLGDPDGRGWDPAFGGPARQAYVDDRPLLLKRTEAALAALAASPRVDASKLAAAGWCFGGRAVADLIRSSRPGDGLRGVLSFHGILDGYEPPAYAAAKASGTLRIDARAFIATANADPFVPRASVDAFLSQLDSAGVDWELQVFGGDALHAFTNPAQAINEKPQFAYDEKAAKASWRAAEGFLLDIFQ